MKYKNPLTYDLEHDHQGFPTVEFMIDFGYIDRMSQERPKGALACLRTAHGHLRDVVNMIERIHPEYARRAKKGTEDDADQEG